MQILGVRIDELSRVEALGKVRGFLGRMKQEIIFTPNPEMLVDAQKDQYFRNVLNSGSLNICDGKGIELVSRGRLKRIPGIDFMLDICALTEKEERSIYLLGSNDQMVVERARSELLRQFSKLHIVGSNKGVHIVSSLGSLTYEKEENDSILNDIIDTAPDILFVAFGHGKQEKWIYENLKHLPSVKVAMGVGGAFDILSGKIKRAPRLFRMLGLEWLWRLLLQPWRIGRIWKATVIFLLYNFRSMDKSLTMWVLFFLELLLLGYLPQETFLWFIYFYNDHRYWIASGTAIILFAITQFWLSWLRKNRAKSKFFLIFHIVPFLIAGAGYLAVYVLLTSRAVTTDSQPKVEAEIIKNEQPTLPITPDSLPKDVHQAQVIKILDNHYALVARRSFNVYLPNIPQTFQEKFVGVLQWNSDTHHWDKFLDIRDVLPASSDKNNPVDLWWEGRPDTDQVPNLLVVDTNGAGSGEGVGKIFVPDNIGLSDWYVKECFDYAYGLGKGKQRPLSDPVCQNVTISRP
ncbi:MAG: WecB/TagA/CpsF family glycosyltransferase [Patescibacteria group bacterium]